MSIFQRLLNLEQMAETSKVAPIFVNDFDNQTEKDIQLILNHVTTQYFGDKISMLPSCRCGFLRMASLKGDTCPRCQTVVESSIENDIQSVLWFRAPEGIRLLMSPIVFTMLRLRFTKQGWDVIQYLTDTTYKPQVRMTSFMTKIMEMNFGRGWNNFIDRFDEIFNYLIRMKDFSVDRGEIDYLWYLYMYHKDKFFTRYLPLPNKSMFVFENTNVGIYRNSPTDKAMTYIGLMLSIDKSLQPLSDRAKQNRVAKLHLKMSEYQDDYIRKELSPKSGQIRRHVIATKTIMSFRTVITSITRPWDYECLEIPWFAGLMMLRPMLINKLDRYGFSVNKAASLILSSVGRWDPLLDRFMDEIIEEAPNQRLSMLFQRNPSLKQGSAQQGYAKIKREPADKTAGVPLPVVRAPNADFDGKLVAVIKPF